MAEAWGDSPLLNDLLKQVSRSFYLTLRVLPKGVRPQIGLAYLLARATDTVADTEIVPVASRLATLESLRNRILGLSSDSIDLSAFCAAPEAALAHAGSNAERYLLTQIEAALGLLDHCSLTDREHIRRVLSTITTGQQLDLERFGAATENQIVALNSAEELDDYTYRVAGCVGEFWTRICRTNLFPDRLVDEARLLEQGIRFGKGLQMVNILRDLPKDLRQGRCYLPRPELLQQGLQPEALLHASNIGRLRNVYDRHLAQANRLLDDGWQYTCSLPTDQIRVRLACAWPVLIGLRTLARLRHTNVLDVNKRVKISHSEVRSLILSSVVLYPFRSAWKRLPEKARAVTA
jgi:farnesyl-diphosphate farnesyltransferase